MFGALGKQARRRAIRWIANFYVWIFRGTPLLVQISLLYFGLSITNIFRWPDINICGFVIPGPSRPASSPWASTRAPT